MGRKRGGRRASAANKGQEFTKDRETSKSSKKQNSATTGNDLSVDDQIAFWKKKEQMKRDGNKLIKVEENAEDEDIDDEEAFDSDDEQKWGSLFASSKNRGVSTGREKKAKIIERESDIDSEGSNDNDVEENEEKEFNGNVSRDNENTDDDEKHHNGKRHDMSDTDEESEDTDGLMGSSDEDGDEGDNDGGQYMLQLLENIDKKDETGMKKGESVVSPKIAESEFSSAVLGTSRLSMDMLMKGIQSESKGYRKLQKDVAQLSGVSDRYDRTSKVLQTARTPASRVVTERALRQVHYAETKKDVSQWNTAIHENRNAETLDFRSKASYDLQLSNAALVGNFTPETEFEQEIAAALEQAGASNEKDILEKERQNLVRNNHDGAFDNIGDDNDDADDEDDALGRRHMTEEEYQKRHAELAKMRALLFYEEQKARHINKIKSKKYRKIRKKQRLKMEQKELEAQMEEDPDLARELEEKEEIQRMKERMTLAHKNTSKWAKHQLQRRRKHGASALDKDTKQALSAQLRTGDELRRKIKSIRGDDDDDSSSSSSSSSSDEEDGKEERGEKRKKKDKLLEKARTVLEETTKEDDSEKKGLVGMSFMQKGLETQRKRAKEEARKLLEELEQNMRANGDGTDDDSSISDGDGRPSDDAEKKKKANKRKGTETDNVDEMITEDNLVANSLLFGKSNAIQLSGGVNVEHGSAFEALPVSGHSVTLQITSEAESIYHKGHRSDKETLPHEDQIQSLQSPQAIVTDALIEKAGLSEQMSPNKRKAGSQPSDDEDERVSPSSSNPWMKVGKKKRKNKKTKLKDTAVGSEASETLLNANEAAKALLENENKAMKTPASESTNSAAQAETLLKTTETKGSSNAVVPVANEQEKVSSLSDSRKSKKVTEMTQEELVQRAFAAPTDTELEEEFEKERTEMSDALSKKKKEKEPTTGSGWGSWTGLGAPPPPPPRRLPKKLQPPPPRAKDEAPRGKEKKPNVIINDAPISKYAELQVQTVPYPYRTRVEYEAAMAGAIGKEWNVSQSVKDMTRPEIQFTKGRIIRPLSKGAKAKQYRAPAKF